MFASLIALGCSSPAPDDSSSYDPEGPVATSAAEAWPDAPAGIPAITEEEILGACSIAGACSDEVMKLDLDSRTGVTDLCVHDAVFSAERAIPMSGFIQGQERAEFWVRCVLDHASDCGAVAKCRTERSSVVYCEEDGCRAKEPLSVVCKGNVAELSGPSGTWTRDCSRAYASCDPESPTGCTDRHWSACPKDATGGDRCDGDVRLGCDGAHQVSYRDCTRMGGTCATGADGAGACVYPHAISPECVGEGALGASCEGGTLFACVNGLRLSTPSPLCSP